MEHLSEEMLLRTAGESYKQILWEEKKQEFGNEWSQMLTEWQSWWKLKEASTGSYLAPAESVEAVAFLLVYNQ